jgi:hypothetical protein
LKTLQFANLGKGRLSSYIWTSKRPIVVGVLISLFSANLAIASEGDTRYIDVVAVTWPGAKSFGVNTSQVESAITNEVNARWKSFTTIEGDTKSRTINFVHGKTLQETLVISRPMSCGGESSSIFMTSIQIETYKELGISDWGSRYLVILVPDSGCIWMGRALIGSNEYPGGVMTLHNSASAFVIAHELGHTVGLGHSNFLRCDSGARDGTWDGDCKAVEYGGTVDAMGNVDVSTPLSTYHQWRMGLLDKEEIQQSWLNDTIDLSASDVIGATRAIFLRDSKSTYWVEYRRANAKASYKPGLVVYRTDPPPSSAVVSPNPEDSQVIPISTAVGSDIWMLNWDNYSYVRSQASGSMTLPQGNTARVYSGNIAITASATSNPNVVRVRITRKPDTIPPPTPLLSSNSTWLYPGAEILSPGYDDAESAIASFEVQADGEEISLPVTNVEKWTPTYLNPFSPPKTLRVRDLPEGSYSLSVRATDLWGNKSAWSAPVKAVIDRSDPVITTEAQIVSVNDGKFDIAWNGISDVGSGLCLSQIANDDGWVYLRSTERTSPRLRIPSSGVIQGKLQVFDCLGNGKSGDLKIETSYLPTEKSRRTGKWIATSEFGSGSMRCIGKCAAIFTASGNVGVLAGSGGASMKVANKFVASISNTTSNQLRLGAAVTLGKRNQVVRISGSNFTLVGLAKLDVSIDKLVDIDRTPPKVDESLADPIQKGLSALGFNQDDFTADWTVLPMNRGTTLLDPSLDLCSANYPSETGRQYRRQVQVTKQGSPFTFLSTEVVKYRGKREADQALSELKSRYSDCVKNKGGIESSGAFVDYSFTEIPQNIASRFNSDNSVVVRAQIGKDANTRQLLVFYQFNGEYFTGMYLVKSGTSAFTDTEVQKWAQVAFVMNSRLENSRTA